MKVTLFVSQSSSPEERARIQALKAYNKLVISEANAHRKGTKEDQARARSKRLAFLDQLKEKGIVLPRKDRLSIDAVLEKIASMQDQRKNKEVLSDHKDAETLLKAASKETRAAFLKLSKQEQDEVIESTNKRVTLLRNSPKYSDKAVEKSQKAIDREQLAFEKAKAKYEAAGKKDLRKMPPSARQLKSLKFMHDKLVKLNKMINSDDFYSSAFKTNVRIRKENADRNYNTLTRH